jgi:hypothetical protein
MYSGAEGAQYRVTAGAAAPTDQKPTDIPLTKSPVETRRAACRKQQTPAKIKKDIIAIYIRRCLFRQGAESAQYRVTAGAAAPADSRHPL